MEPIETLVSNAVDALTAAKEQIGDLPGAEYLLERAIEASLEAVDVWKRANERRQAA